MVKALAAFVDRRERNDLERLEKAGLHDPAGLFRQFNLGHRMMRRRLARARDVTDTPRARKRR
jgi:hypothetical protein